MKYIDQIKRILCPCGIFLLLLCAAFPLSAGSAETVVTGTKEKLEFNSESYENLPDILKGRASSVATVSATLSFPGEVKEKYPAIILMHGIAGYQESCEGWYAAAFSKAGFAVLSIESAKARAIRDAPLKGGWSLFGPMVADAYYALNLLAKNPRIDADKIAIAGFSIGGDVAHITAFEPLRAVFAKAGLLFTAHISFYPTLTWGIEAGGNTYTGSPVLMLLGDKDDCGPPSKFQIYTDYAKQAGFPAPVETIVYPDAYHGWGNAWYTQTTFNSRLASPRKCPIILLAPRSPNGLTLLGARGIIPFNQDRWNACMADGKGYHVSFDEKIRDQSLADALSFLQKTLK